MEKKFIISGEEPVLFREQIFMRSGDLRIVSEYIVQTDNIHSGWSKQRSLGHRAVHFLQILFPAFKNVFAQEQLSHQPLL